MRQQIILVAALVLLLALATSTIAASNRHARLTPRPVVSQPTTTSRVSWYTRFEEPQGWTKLHAAGGEEQLTFTLVVKGSNADELERRFWSRSDPDSEEFAEWMTNAEIEQLVAPSSAELKQLYSALAEHGIVAEQVVSHGDSFDVTASVSQASSLFATQFFRFQHSTGKAAIRQWGEYSLPASIAEQTEIVLGVHTFPTFEQRQQMRARRAARNQAIAAAKKSRNDDSTPVWVPQALAAVYGVPHPIAPLAYKEVGAGVIEWEEQTFRASDLRRFSNATMIPLAAVGQHHIVGNNTEAPPGIEASLDIQWIEGLNPGSTPWFWLVNGDDSWMYTFTVEFLSAKEYPAVISMSYGVPELDNCDPDFFGKDNDCHGLSYQQYQALVDKQFMKMGLLGVSVVSANSDNGVYNAAPKPAIFLPNYPGTSAYVTTAGATEMANPVYNLPNPPPACAQGDDWQCISSGDEQAVSGDIAGFLSGGGFSNVTLRPSWQADAVDAYLSSGVKLPDESLWNRSGRAIPDVTAQGWNGYIVNGGEANLVSGTSMSTPIVASIFALLHHDFHNITNTTLGFLNPLLYKGQGAGAGLFTDITVGNNCDDDGCNNGHIGFECTKGWDPVSGLGSPMYPNMKKYVQQLAHRVVERRAAKQQRQQQK